MAVINHPLGDKANAYIPYIDEKYNTTTPSASITYPLPAKISVYNMVKGEVTKVDKDETLGNFLIIKSSDWNYCKKTNQPLYITYCHLSKIDKKEGDEVQTGELIATSGESGSLAEGGVLTIFFSEQDNIPKISSIDVSNYKEPDELKLLSLKKKEKNGEMTELKAENLKQYIHKIFGQEPIQKTIAVDLNGENVPLIVAIAAQEINWGGNNPTLSRVAKTEAVCRIIRNRSYKLAYSLTDAAMGLVPDTPYDTMVENFTGSMNQTLGQNMVGVYGTAGKGIRFYDFVTYIVSGGDYGLPEAYLNSISKAYNKNDLYAVTGFMSSARANNYKSSIIAEWDDFACMNWNYFPSNSSKTVNNIPPVR